MDTVGVLTLCALLISGPLTRISRRKERNDDERTRHVLFNLCNSYHYPDMGDPHYGLETAMTIWDDLEIDYRVDIAAEDAWRRRADRLLFLHGDDPQWLDDEERDNEL